MLKSLSVRNYAIIDDLSIDFGKSFNVFTGETGAGKSIIIGALSFLFRGRSDTSIIMTGKDKAIIEGVFVTDDESVIKELADNDIEYDGELIIRRTVSKDKGSSIRINGSSVTLSFLSALSERLFDIHSQRDSIYLLDPKRQLDLIDRFASISKAEYSKKYLEYRKIQKEIDELESREFSEREIEFISFDLKELEDARLSSDEEEDLITKEKLAANFRKYEEAGSLLTSLYNGDGGIKEKLYDLIAGLQMDDLMISEKRGVIDDLYYSLDDAITDLADYLKKVGSDDINTEEIAERLYIYSKLKRKHKTDTAGLIALQADLRAKVDLFADREQIMAEKQNQLKSAYNALMIEAENLSQARKSAATVLCDKVRVHTNDLMLPNCHFEVRFIEKDPGSNGIDEVEFMVAMNKGEDLRSLKNTASGGEISRLMLALKTVFSAYNSVELMVFDEIDTGVSGKVAKAVGQKMAAIAKSVQVICITHLAPVAAFSDNHYFIYKEDADERTVTSVRELDEAGKIRELAMISSGGDDDKSLAAAKELYNEAQGLK